MISIRKKTDQVNVTATSAPTAMSAAVAASAAPAQKSGWLQLSSKIDCGLLLLVELAKDTTGEPVSLRTVADHNGVSFFFLQKVAADLRRAGIVDSGRGKHGGYSLARPATKISLKDIVEAHEGPLSIMGCLDHEQSCVRENWCDVRPGLKFINYTILQTLAATSLADFLNPEQLWKTYSK